MLAAKHCSMLFSTALNRLHDFGCVIHELTWQHNELMQSLRYNVTTAVQGAVVQSWFSVNPVLKLNPLF